MTRGLIVICVCFSSGLFLFGVMLKKNKLPKNFWNELNVTQKQILINNETKRLNCS